MQVTLPIVAPKCPAFFSAKEWRITLSDFFQHAMETWVSILEAERSQTWSECAFYAHRLKGSAALLGFDQLSQSAAACETAFREKPEGRERLMNKLQDALINVSTATSSESNQPEHKQAS
jgi:HPt (histidine-containing phosphotransfer) domain-containing protein